MGRLEKNLTQGKVSPVLISFTLPLIASSILQSLYGMVDMLIVGRYLGSEGISAINNGSQIMLIITKVAIGISTGGNVILSQFYGKGDERSCRRIINNIIQLMIFIGLILSVAFYVLSPQITSGMKAPAYQDTVAYFKTCSIGILLIFVFNGVIAALRAYGNSRYPMYFTLISAILNVILDIIFIKEFHMGVGGAAVATVISQGVATVCGCVVLFKFLNNKKNSDNLKEKQDVKKLDMISHTKKRILEVGVPCAIQMTIGGISWLYITYLLNQYGVGVSAGNGIAVKIKEFIQLVIHAIANGAIVMIGQSLGAGLEERAKKVMYSAMKIALLFSIISIIVIELFAPSMTRIFSSDPDTIYNAVLNLRIEIISQIFYAIFLVYHAMAIGSGHSIFALISTFTNSILMRVILCYIFERHYGLRGIYIGCMLAPMISIPMGAWFVHSNKWKIVLKKEIDKKRGR